MKQFHDHTVLRGLWMTSPIVPAAGMKCSIIVAPEHPVAQDVEPAQEPQPFASGLRPP
jgi:hypothetical protein